MEIALSQPMPRVDPDSALIRSMAAGDEGALRALYAVYGRRLYAYAYRLTGSEPVAEEVVQDSLLAAWQGAARFRGDSRAATWLLGIVHHQALNAVRRKRLPADGLEQAAAVADGDACPESHTEAGERSRALRAALGRLSREHRAALELVFYQGLSLAEAAEVLGCPVGTVKSRLSYAKANLQEILTRDGWRAEDMR
ncbi:MAG TPA: sigma-70 family RNA polymerase sigma factor [Anaerolineae bacterium]|nr:sigma-70 family RNA polymerase sigma factor [Anaerolineae bacterium]HOQ97829.1 sigma-70 family RNA polymerase sigma factor [Anaerolineae bacterium]HPL30515.1 sigma-70 family RNA polymerase sigma factor [Anaerolineae bacterium]